jgi:hypothetical protein
MYWYGDATSSYTALTYYTLSLSTSLIGTLYPNSTEKSAPSNPGPPHSIVGLTTTILTFSVTEL